MAYKIFFQVQFFVIGYANQMQPYSAYVALHPLKFPLRGAQVPGHFFFVAYDANVHGTVRNIFFFHPS